jgi:hypothetical protein
VGRDRIQARGKVRVGESVRARFRAVVGPGLG